MLLLEWGSWWGRSLFLSQSSYCQLSQGSLTKPWKLAWFCCFIAHTRLRPLPPCPVAHIWHWRHSIFTHQFTAFCLADVDLVFDFYNVPHMLCIMIRMTGGGPLNPLEKTRMFFLLKSWICRYFRATESAFRKFYSVLNMPSPVIRSPPT